MAKDPFAFINELKAKAAQHPKEKPTAEQIAAEVLGANKDLAKKAFEAELKGKYDNIPGGEWETLFPNINFGIFKQDKDLFISIAFKNKLNKTTYNDILLAPNGNPTVRQERGLHFDLVNQLLDNIPEYKNLQPNLKSEAAQVEVIKEAARIVELLSISELPVVEMEITIISPTDKPEVTIPTGPKEKDKETKQVGQDPERIDVLKSLPGAFITIIPKIISRENTKKTGGKNKSVKLISEYIAVLGPEGAICDCPVCRNAIYGFKFSERVPEDTIQKARAGDTADLVDFLHKVGFIQEVSQDKRTLFQMGKKIYDHPKRTASPQKKQEFRDKLAKFFQENYA